MIAIFCSNWIADRIQAGALILPLQIQVPNWTIIDIFIASTLILRTQIIRIFLGQPLPSPSPLIPAYFWTSLSSSGKGSIFLYAKVSAQLDPAVSIQANPTYCHIESGYTILRSGSLHCSYSSTTLVDPQPCQHFPNSWTCQSEILSNRSTPN